MKMLVTLDGSPFAEAVLPKAAALAGSGNVEVVLAMVLKPSDIYTTWRTPISGIDFAVNEVFPGSKSRECVMVETKDQAVDRALHEAKEYLDDQAKRFFIHGARTEVLIGDHLAQELLAYVRREGFDLVAMATHGRTGIAKLVMGSVASEVLQSKEVPVLLMRPKSLAPVTA